MKGFGTDEKTLIRVLSNKDPLQIEVIRTTYERSIGRNLIKDLKSETSSWFESGLVQLARGPLLADVHNLFDSMSGPGTKELVMNDILLSRSNADMRAIKSAYRHTFHRSLEDAVRGDLSMKTERHFMMVLSANRAEDGAPVIPQETDKDVMDIYKATEGKMGTDELLVCHIFSHRSDNQIRAIAHSYKQKFTRNLEQVIDSVSLLLQTLVKLNANSTAGILWTHERCSSLPTSTCRRQIYACCQVARRFYGRHGNQGPPFGRTGCSLPLGSQ